MDTKDDDIRRPLLEHSFETESSSHETMSGLDSQTAERLLITHGRNEIPEKVVPAWKVLLIQFTGTMPFMIEVACILALAVQRWEDFAIILTMLLVNAGLGFHEEMKTRTSVDALKGSLEHKVSAKRDGEFKQIDACLLVPGDLIFLRGGHIVPADCSYVGGDVLQVDTAALTGEPFPIKIPREDSHADPGSGKRLLSGFIIKSGEGYALVKKTGLQTEIGQAAASIQDSPKPVHGLFETKVLFILKLVIISTILLTLVVLFVQVFVRKHGIEDVLIQSLSLVIASVPIALPLVIQVTMAIGAKIMSEHKAIVTHMTALQEIASMTVLCSDKTGTLTTAKITIYHDQIWCATSRFSQDEILIFAAIASNSHNKDDPIDVAVIRSFSDKFGSESENIRATFKVERFVGFNPIYKRTVAYVSRGSQKLKISKGLVDKVLDTGDDGGDCWTCERANEIRHILKKKDEDFAFRGFKTLAVSVSVDDGPMIFAGIIPMQDPPREDTRQTIANIKNADISVKMITGDHLNIAKETARQIELGTNILLNTVLWPASAERDDLIFNADGFAQVLPKDKQEVVAVLQNRGLVVGMTGDGVNDAPALAKAQIGIAVEGATDAAKSAADILLTEPGLSPIYQAVIESRKIFKRLRSYVLYRLAATLQIVLVLSILIFLYDNELSALYVILLALFNDVSMMPVAYDHAVASKSPETPTIRGLLVVSTILGVVETVQSFGLYEYGHKFLSHKFTIHGESLAYAQASIYLQMSIAVELLIFSCRTPGFWFLSKPSPYLVASVMFSNILITIAAGTGVVVHRLEWVDIVYIWIYDIVWLFITDICKIFSFALLTGEVDSPSTWYCCSYQDMLTVEEETDQPGRHSMVDVEYSRTTTTKKDHGYGHDRGSINRGSVTNRATYSASISARASLVQQQRVHGSSMVSRGSLLPSTLKNPRYSLVNQQ